MNPLILASIITAWLIVTLFAWALVHGAQILRRQEAADLITAAQERELDEALADSPAEEVTAMPFAA